MQPLKLKEYLATGRLSSALDFLHSAWDDAWTLLNDPAEFAAAVNDVVASAPEPQSAARERLWGESWK